MNVKNCGPFFGHGALAATSIAALLLVGCGGSDDDPVAAIPPITAQVACTNLSGKTVGGAALSAVAVAASGAVPTYCKVNGTILPSLRFEMRLPDTWNGKLHYGGGGVYNGSIPGLTGTTLAALKQGYSTVSSDSGHQANGLDASWALNDPVAAQLFGNLSIPTVMSTALEAVTAAYGKPPEKSYFEGCSNGGREGLMNVQRYPNLFDGVVVRAPAYNWVGFNGHFNKTAKALGAPGGNISNAKTATLAAAVRNSCDGLDGIVDGVVSNRAACTAAFNPATLRCAGGADTGDTCLSDAQLAVVTTWTTDSVYSGSPTYRNAGWSLTGNENDPGAWPIWVTGNGNFLTSIQYLFSDTTVKNYLARDPTANSLTYAPWDQNPSAIYSMAALNDATNPEIRPFFSSGGKLIIWHGANDMALNPNQSIEYYNNVRNTVGTATADASMRFYIAPGVNHCAGGPGADSAELLTALDQWVRAGTAPGTLVAEKRDSAGAVQFSRPLCQHPQYPRYTGPAGDANAAKLAASYTCTTP
jgi:feruloyl esterase